jgi:hypothetical protein
MDSRGGQCSVGASNRSAKETKESAEPLATHSASQSEDIDRFGFNDLHRAAI